MTRLSCLRPWSVVWLYRADSFGWTADFDRDHGKRCQALAIKPCLHIPHSHSHSHFPFHNAQTEILHPSIPTMLGLKELESQQMRSVGTSLGVSYGWKSTVRTVAMSIDQFDVENHQHDMIYPRQIVTPSVNDYDRNRSSASPLFQKQRVCRL